MPVDYPNNLKVPDQMMNIDKYAKPNERPRQTTDCQPQLIEEYILETERDDNEGRRVVYHIKLSIFRRPSNSEYLGELYVDRDYREGTRNGESCRFPLGTRVHVNRYIQQFTEIFTEERRKAVKITHFTGSCAESDAYGYNAGTEAGTFVATAATTTITTTKAGGFIGSPAATTTYNTTTHITATTDTAAAACSCCWSQWATAAHNTATVQHVNSSTTQTQPVQQHHVAKNINIVNVTGNNAAAVQHILRQQQLQQQHQHQQQQQVATTQFIDTNGATVQLQHATLTANNTTSNAGTNTVSSGPHHIQLQQITTGAPSGSNGGGAPTTTTHQLSLSNGSLVLVQQHPAGQSVHHQQTHQALQHAGITIQPANTTHQQQAQQKTQVITTTQLNSVTSGNTSALRTQLSSNVPILQAQLKAAPTVANSNQQQQQQQLMHKQQNTANSATNTANVASGNTVVSTTTTLHANPAINAIVTSIMNSDQHYGNNNTSNSNTSTTTSTLKSSSNASILSLLNSAPSAMTSTPVASGTFTATSGSAPQQQQQQQTVTLVQYTTSHSQQPQQQQTATVVTTDNFVQATTQPPPQTVPNQTQLKQNEVLQNLLNPGRKINIVSSAATNTNICRHQHNSHSNNRVNSKLKQLPSTCRALNPKYGLMRIDFNEPYSTKELVQFYNKISKEDGTLKLYKPSSRSLQHNQSSSSLYGTDFQ